MQWKIFIIKVVYEEERASGPGKPLEVWDISITARAWSGNCGFELSLY
jgi:hypothetical protein